MTKRRFALRSLVWLVLGGLLLVSLIVLLPLRLVLGAVPSLSARTVHGSAWGGDAQDLQLRSLALGDVEAGLAPLPLLIGRREIWLERRGGEPLAARLASSGDGLRLSVFEGTVSVVDVAPDLPGTSARFSRFGLRFEHGRCVEAHGQVQVDTVVSTANSPARLTLSGRAQCRSGKLFLRLAGAGGMERMDLIVDGNGRWTADFTLLGFNAGREVMARGFSARSDGYGMRASGTF